MQSLQLQLVLFLIKMQAGIKEIRQLIEQEKERGALILLASHNQDDMKILADQVYKIADGRIERKGTEL